MTPGVAAGGCSGEGAAVTLLHGDALAILPTLGSASVDLVFGSPPYPLKGRRYDGLGERFGVREWVGFMVALTKESVRVCRGDVIWVVNAPVVEGAYQPAIEGLLWAWYEAGGKLDRPCIWHKNAPPTPKHRWFSNSWEYVVCFPRPGPRAVFDWEAIARQPVHTFAGSTPQRTAGGRRPTKPREYLSPSLARPRDVFHVAVGGGQMGHKAAHRNEAPFPVALAERFVKVLTRPGDTVLDPVMGSGTTGHAAKQCGRKFVGIEIRESQVLLARRRLATVTPPLFA